MEEIKGFDSFAIVEVMGHNQFAGHVTERSIAGHGFIQVEVPELPEKKRQVESYRGGLRRTVTRVLKPVPGYVKILGAASIYAITPCTEAEALAAAESQANGRDYQDEIETAAELEAAQMERIDGPTVKLDDDPEPLDVPF